MSEYSVRAYGDELAQLTAEVARMGGLAEAQVADAVDCVARRDVGLAQAVVGRDERLDLMQREIERRAIRIIALRQPMAVDLRRTVSAIKLALELERTGDMAKNIAKRALLLADSEPMSPLTRSVERMGRLVVSRLKSVLDAYTASEVERAVAVWQTDDEVDEQRGWVGEDVHVVRRIVSYQFAAIDEDALHLDRMAELVKKRDAYVADQRKNAPAKPADSFDRAVAETLKVQIKR